MKRIALFSITYDPFIGGAEVAIKEVTDRLPDFEFDLFTAKLGKKLARQERVGRINVYRVGGGHKLWDKWLYPWRAAALALKLHRQNPYDLAHAVLETYAALAALIFKKRRPLVPYVLTLQSGDTDSFLWKRTWFWQPLYRQVYTKADKITAISRWLAIRARRYGYKGEIAIIPNGVDVEHFGGAMQKSERNFIRSSWGVAEKAFVIVTASRLVFKNGVDIIIESLKYLPPDVVLVIAGSGEDEEKLKFQVSSFPTTPSAVAKALADKRLRRAGKFQDRVVFLGHIDHNSLPRVLKAADVFVRPSRSEGLGNAFLEAMAAGLPVVATPVGGIVDFIKDGESGLLVAPDNASQLAQVINELKQNSALRQSLIKNGRILVKSKYDWDSIAAAYKNIYQIW